ncbi:hypothetical protein EUX98_g3763 [Antrodiella citrinella]|uniref:BTB domain-containing protein n=1 Tax=Antrodiella citrinella TaxID=2447956 RepID=A0A4S4MVQ3_9APHY|nr:hypothetical protein EUX98_g3763 [Antrodiella citrinella]
MHFTNFSSPLSTAGRLESVDVNARDSLGRTVLHLAASSSDASATEYVRMLLAHSTINPNLQDYESHWTALHRALYCGNVASALLLLQRSDIDCNLKDLEGYRAFDLYNSTVHGTKPEASSRMDLFTWGANRNAALGLGDGDDRVHPDQVVIERLPKVSEQDTLDTRFEPVRVDQVVMSKLHTAVVTHETRANVRACGFGSGGRLGQANHTQYTLLPLPLLPQSASNASSGSTSSTAIVIASLALGQDHTLALTSTGDVYSWGMNRFSQLGYPIDPLSTPGVPRHQQEDVSMVQSAPRKITAPSLKGKHVTGIAACRTASVCWSRDEVWTWGTNGGQLGYDKSAHPTQILPRKVTKVVLPVLQISIMETAMACLLESHDVICIYNDATFKINFPTQTFPSSMPTYRPPQAVRNASIKKVTASPSGDGFAALSENGELFLCTMSTRDVSHQQSGRDSQVKVQRVWALRKQFSAVKDVELSVDGSIIICTESGHVFIRSRNPNLSAPSSSSGSLLSSTNPNSGSNAKTFKFQRISFIQRVVRVCANSLGAYGALRVDADPTALGPGHGLEVTGAMIQESLKGVRSWLAFGEDSRRRMFLGTGDIPSVHPGAMTATDREDDEADQDDAIARDINEFNKLTEVLERQRLSQMDPSSVTSASVMLFRLDSSASKWFDPASLPISSSSAFGADLVVHVKAFHFSAHRLMLATRSDVLLSVMEDGRIVESSTKEGKIKVYLGPAQSSSKAHHASSSRAPWHTQTHLSISGVHPLTILVLLTYIYTDELLTYWDPRVAPHIFRRLSMINMSVRPMQIQRELQRLASLLGLNDALIRALEGSSKRVLEPSLAKELLALSDAVQTPSVVAKSLSPDVVLVLSDIQVPCHSTILRSRSPFFRAFFDDEDWTRERWTDEGVINVDLKHLGWKVGRFVLWYLYGGDVEMFERLDFVRSVDDLVEFMFDIMAAATELLLDRLVLICSSVILKRVTVANVCSILAEATHFHAEALTGQIQRYIAVNLETLLETHMLDDLPFDLIKQLSAYIRSEQEVKSPISRSGQLTKKALEANKDWLALQDIPGLILRSSRIEGKNLAKLSPPGPGRKRVKSGAGSMTSPPPSPAVRPQFEARAPQPSAAMGAGDGEVFMMDDTVPSFALDQTQAPPSPSTQAKSSSGWKVSTTYKVDMKTIIAEAETSKKPALGTPRQDSAKPADVTNWRTPQRPDASAILRTPSGGSPWKVPSVTSPAFTLKTPPTTPVMRPVRSKEDVTHALRLSQADTRQEPPASPRIPPSMGPVFIPKKTTSSPSKNTPSPGFRRVSSGISGSAWTLPPVQPIVQPSITEGAPMSFAAIQQLQREQDAPPAKDKRSLKQIQEEEQAKQVEEDFLKWWAAEEERARLEEAAMAGTESASTEQRPKRERGKGKGKVQAAQKAGPQLQEGVSASRSVPPTDSPSGKSGGAQRRKGRSGPPNVNAKE